MVRALRIIVTAVGWLVLAAVVVLVVTGCIAPTTCKLESGEVVTLDPYGGKGDRLTWTWTTDGRRIPVTRIVECRQ